MQASRQDEKYSKKVRESIGWASEDSERGEGKESR